MTGIDKRERTFQKYLMGILLLTATAAAGLSKNDKKWQRVCTFEAANKTKKYFKKCNGVQCVYLCSSLVSSAAPSCPQPVVWQSYNRYRNVTNPVTWAPAVAPVCISSGPASYGFPAFGTVNSEVYPNYCRITTSPNFPSYNDQLDFEVKKKKLTILFI